MKIQCYCDLEVTMLEIADYEVGFYLMQTTNIVAQQGCRVILGTQS